MGAVEAIYENGVFKPLKRPKSPEKRKVEPIILGEFIRDLNDAFETLEEGQPLGSSERSWTGMHLSG